jgi:hypothetical protein
MPTDEILVNMQPTDIAAKALEAIKADFIALLGRASQELDERLVVLSSDMANYWHLVDAGKTTEAEEQLKWMQAEAKAIAARYAIEMTSTVVSGALRIVETVARIGGILLRGFLAAG